MVQELYGYFALLKKCVDKLSVDHTTDFGETVF